MSYRPTTYCRVCNEPFDVYRAPEDRICDGCLETMGEDEDECDDGDYNRASRGAWAE
jgi:hypothetical protein